MTNILKNENVANTAIILTFWKTFNMVYRVLGKLLWKGGIKEAEVVILHRGAPDDRKTIPGRRIKEIKKGFLVYLNQQGEETVIPYHRVLEVRKDGKAIWKKHGKA